MTKYLLKSVAMKPPRIATTAIKLLTPMRNDFGSIFFQSAFVKARTTNAITNTVTAPNRKSIPPKNRFCTSTMWAFSLSLKNSLSLPSTMVSTTRFSRLPRRYAIISSVTYMASSISISKSSRTSYFRYSFSYQP